MTDALINAIPQLGLGAFAMYILWRFGDSHSKRLKEKDEEAASERRTFLDEMKTNQTAFRQLEAESRTFLMAENTKMGERMMANAEVMAKTTEVMGQNIKALERITVVLDRSALGRRNYDKPKV